MVNFFGTLWVFDRSVFVYIVVFFNFLGFLRRHIIILLISTEWTLIIWYFVSCWFSVFFYDSFQWPCELGRFAQCNKTFFFCFFSVLSKINDGDDDESLRTLDTLFLLSSYLTNTEPDLPTETHLKQLRPAFEYKTYVTRLPTQNPHGSQF